MAHFARINDDSIVEAVVVVPDEEEHRGADFLSNDLGLGGVWVQTSYTSRAGNRVDPNTNEVLVEGEHFRFNYAGVGFRWDPNFGQDGAFISPKPEDDGEWVISPDSATWVPAEPRQE